MISLKVILMPKGKYLLKDNCEQELKNLCNYFMIQNRFDHIIGSDNQQKKIYNFSVESDVKVSPLLCSNYEKNGNYIIFKDEVKWYISSHSYDLILHLVQGLFKERILRINNAEFEVLNLEVSDTFDAFELSEVS